MDISLAYQLVEAGLSVALGFVFGIVYDLFRIMRRRFGLKHVTALIDALYWLLAAAALFFFSSGVSQRGYRAFMFIFAVMGGAVYFYTLSASIMWMLERFADFLLLVVRIVLFPIKFLVKILKKILEILKKVFQYLKKWFTINYNRSKYPKVKAVHVRGTKEGRFEEKENRNTDNAHNNDYYGLRSSYAGWTEFKNIGGPGAKSKARAGSVKHSRPKFRA